MFKNSEIHKLDLVCRQVRQQLYQVCVTDNDFIKYKRKKKGDVIFSRNYHEETASEVRRDVHAGRKPRSMANQRVPHHPYLDCRESAQCNRPNVSPINTNTSRFKTLRGRKLASQVFLKSPREEHCKGNKEGVFSSYKDSLLLKKTLKSFRITAYNNREAPVL